MRVLVACEFSGTVRDAFRKAGHDAWSCDLDPDNTGSPFHIQEDIIHHLRCGWDLMIAHPPCTYLCNSGVRWLKDENGPHGFSLQRMWKMFSARSFFFELYSAPIERICIENPVPHGYAMLPPYTQTVQPWQFGHGETKRTCLWLKNLPPLVPTNVVEGREGRIHKMPPSKDRGKLRSVTYQGIAEAMASQWG